ncbi:uncharacterized protein LOC120007295 [Tripterygium wilfordii]|uniref:uncharacterized protein LOC120007295 n=1 Tax=Tripterygium wilfordii TaxID=458696 RepID=UPI0018F80A24|nr:uncharacterized protein LOC120007295 [Tripterygium wilfordii]
MSKNLLRPKEILCTIKNRYPSNATTLRTIYNARQRHRVIEKAGRTQMQYLLGKLFDLKYYEYHRSSIDDCTYKTNRYRMPLFEVVGITSTCLTFSIAFAYIGGERIYNYLWVLQRLRSIMEDNSIELPLVIVTDRELWHINKNILAKCKKMFSDKASWELFDSIWNTVVLADNEDDYLRRVNDLMTTFNRNPSPVEYVLDTWLNPYKERFVAAFTNKYKHLGTTATNRRTYGIPCSHELARYVRDDVPIPLSALDTHWSRLQIIPRDPPYVSQVMKEDPSKWSYYQRKIREVFDPNTTHLTEPRDKFKTRVRLSKAELSTHRAPSAFELVDSTCIDKSSQSSKLTSTDKKIFVSRNSNITSMVVVEKPLGINIYRGQFPSAIDKYINDIVDVAADGNCGYRAVAGLMGIDVKDG